MGKVDRMKKIVKGDAAWIAGMIGVVATSLVAAGCGGGGSAGLGSQSGSPSTKTLGNTRSSFFGTPSTQQSTNSSGVSITGLSGAAFVYIDLYPQKTLANTSIAYARGGQIWTYNVATGTSNMITALTGNAGFSGGPSWTNAGHIAFSTTKADGTPLNTYTCKPDGSGLSKLPISANSVLQRPAYAPNYNYIAGYNTTNDLCVESSTGGSPVILVSHTNLDQVGSVGWLNSSTIFFQENVSGTEQLFQIPVSGGTPTAVTAFNNATTGTYDLQASASLDGTTIAYNSGGATTPATTILNLTTGSSLNVTALNMNYLYPTIAPNNTQFAVWGEDQGTTLNDGSFGIYSALIDGENPVLISADPTGGAGTSAYTSSFPSWQPFPTYQRMVGATGPLGTTSSGYFLAQNGDAFSSMLSYTAVTPSKVVVTPPANGSSSNAQVYTVIADTISNIDWTNSYYVAGTSQTLTGATGFLVSFSSATGQIGFVSTFNGPSTQFKRQATSAQSNSQITYSGHFKNVFDATGRNLAPNGASSIVIDNKTGKVVSFL